jgi:hypothetical protein
MFAWVGNQPCCGVVIAWVQTDAVLSFHHQRRDLHQSTYPVPLRRSGLMLLSTGIRILQLQSFLPLIYLALSHDHEYNN